MLNPSTMATLFLLIPLAVVIIYYDVRYRRIPNAVVLATLISGLLINLTFGGWRGGLSSVGGCALAFTLMLVLHVFGAMGAGDVKLFSALGAVTGAHLVLPTFMVVILTGGVLALISILRSGAIAATMYRVLQILVGLLPGWEMPKFTIPADRRHTVPYGVAITIGGLISIAVFRY
jgi:prepilin peptidase CpaA